MKYHRISLCPIISISSITDKKRGGDVDANMLALSIKTLISDYNSMSKNKKGSDSPTQTKHINLKTVFRLLIKDQVFEVSSHQT